MSKPLKINLILLGFSILMLAGKIYYLSTEEVRAQAPSAVFYGVSMNNDTGFLNGYAWSESIGWIKFGGLTGFPGGASTIAQNAQIVSNKLIGWARACAGTKSGDCSSMVSRTDGWDGWISLGGKASDATTYNISYDNATQDFSGYAWGSDIVSGISFHGTTNDGNTYGVKLSSIIITDITIDIFSAVPDTIYKNNSTTINWHSIGADTCIITKNVTGLTPEIFSASATSGSKSVVLPTNTTFTAECKNVGNSLSESIPVMVVLPPPPKHEISVEPGIVTWLVEDATSCNLMYPNGDIAFSSTGGGVNTFAPDTLDGGIIFTLECMIGETKITLPPVTSIKSVPKSICTPSQLGGDNNIYVNRNTLWKVSPYPEGEIIERKWGGTNISGEQTGTEFNKIYTTIGPKIIYATTTGKFLDGSSFTSVCTATTTVKLDSGTSGEI
jgi:hypothetical protein